MRSRPVLRDHKCHRRIKYVCGTYKTGICYEYAAEHTVCVLVRTGLGEGRTHIICLW